MLDVLDDYLAMLAEAPAEKTQLDDPDDAEPQSEPMSTVDEPGTVSSHE